MTVEPHGGVVTVWRRPLLSGYRKAIAAHLVERAMSGDYAHWTLAGDGRWTRIHQGEDGQPLPDIQAALIAMHAKRRRKARR